MNCKNILLGSFAIILSFLVLDMPIAAATNINIIFNGVQETADLSPENLINKQISIKHEASDITWTKVKVIININSASLAHAIQRIYLFKCRNLNPVECAKLSPQTFDNWVDTELLWSDISERTGKAPYPETANLLFLVKMEGLDKQVSWSGFWEKIERTDYNVFNQYSYELGSLDVYAKSMDFVQPIKIYIENYNMIPFNWITKVVFRGAESLFGIGGDKGEMDMPSLHAAHPLGNEIEAINKDFFLIFPEISSGIADALTLNLNPSFTCGDNRCETNLGESSSNCCYDCGCEEGYCDVADSPETGVCKDDEQISIEVTGVTTPQISECTEPYIVDISTRILNPPSKLPEQLTGKISLNGTFYSVGCSSEQPGIYSCPVSLMPEVECGAGSYQIGPNRLNYTLTYLDGPNQVSKDISTEIPDIIVNYDCSCRDGFYCDVVEGCSSEASITLSIISVTSFLKNYNPAGDWVNITARINNPPSDMAIVGTTYEVNGTSGSVTCTEVDHIYTCSIPIKIPDYDHSKQYILFNNSLTFTITFSSGPLIITKDIFSRFADITIPSYRCGDGTCNVEESSETCCLDCGCPEGLFCDFEKGCSAIEDISLSVDSVYPTEVSDCMLSHIINITARIINPPTDMQLSYYYYIENGEVSGWNIQCELRNPELNDGLVDCNLIIPPITGCELPSYDIGPNKLNITISFQNGTREVITKTISDDFPVIKIIPVYHCGDGIPEPEFGESGENCCIDVPCETDPNFGADYYCDFNPNIPNQNGTCKPKANIKLVVDSPKVEVRFDSCEKTNQVNAKVHIDNAPSGMRVGHFFAQLNASDALIRCEPITEFGQILNYSSWNCSIRVPKVFECHEGRIYRYSPNRIGVSISYPDGFGVATSVLNASFADVVTIQKIRSMKDIIDESVAKLRGELAGSMSIIKELADRIQECMEIMYLMAWLGILGTVAYGIGSFVEKTFDAETMKAIGGTASFLGTIFGNMCNMIKEMYNLELKRHEMNMEIIEMEACIQIAQHEIDAKKIDTPDQSWSAYQRMISCMSKGWSNLDNTMDDMMDSLEKTTGYTGNIADTFGKIGELWERTGLFGYGKYEILVLPEGWRTSASTICSARAHYTDENIYTITEWGVAPLGCKTTTVNIIGRDNYGICKDKLYIVKEISEGNYALLSDPGTKIIKLPVSFYDLFEGLERITFSSKDTITIALCCDRNKDRQCEEKEVIKNTKTQLTGVVAYDASKDSQREENWQRRHCICEGIAAPESVTAKRQAREKLIVRINPSKTVVEIGNELKLNATVQMGTPPYHWTWEFKRGGISGGKLTESGKGNEIQPVTRNFIADTEVKLTVYDSEGKEATATAYIYIKKSLRDEYVNLEVLKGSKIPLIGKEVTFKASIPEGVGTKPYTYTWYCDSTKKEPDCKTINTNSLTDECTCTYNQAGKYTVKVVVNDSAGNKGTATMEINVRENKPPTIPSVKIKVVNGKTEDGKPTIKSTLKCEITRESTDPEGEEVTYTYKWYAKAENKNKILIISSHKQIGSEYLRDKKGSTIYCEVIPYDRMQEGKSGWDAVEIVNIKPKLELNSPENRSYIKKMTTTFSVRVIDEDDDEITAYFYVNDTEQERESKNITIRGRSMTIPFDLDLSKEGLNPGKLIMIRVRDKSGEWSNEIVWIMKAVDTDKYIWNVKK